jgi:hypothetical protein
LGVVFIGDLVSRSKGVQAPRTPAPLGHRA